MSDKTQSSIHAYQMTGLIMVILLVVGLGGWSAIAHISGAVIAQGQVVVESNSKKVQHLEGGIVSQILVKNGDYVEQGQLLLRLDEVETQANLAIIDAQLDELLARQARLEAERDESSKFAFPSELTARQGDAKLAKILNGQRTLFDARRIANAGRKEQLTERIDQLGDEILGLEAQQEAKKQQLNFIRQELEGIQILKDKDLVPITRLLALQREEAKLKGEHGQLTSDIARARGRIGETKLSIIQIDQDFRTEVLDELRDAQTKIAELQERRVAAQSRLKRLNLTAPQSGIVHQLSVHTVGGVITPSEPTMLIVPKTDSLVLDSQVEPQYIDQIRKGQKAVVRFSAFEQATTPELTGEVVRVSADLTQETPDQLPYYAVRVKLSSQELERIADKELKPGMPAEVFISTGERTALSYFLKPLSDQINRTFRER